MDNFSNICPTTRFSASLTSSRDATAVYKSPICYLLVMPITNLTFYIFIVNGGLYYFFSYWATKKAGPALGPRSAGGGAQESRTRREEKEGPVGPVRIQSARTIEMPRVVWSVQMNKQVQNNKMNWKWWKSHCSKMIL